MQWKFFIIAALLLSGCAGGPKPKKGGGGGGGDGGGGAARANPPVPIPSIPPLSLDRRERDKLDEFDPLALELQRRAQQGIGLDRLDSKVKRIEPEDALDLDPLANTQPLTGAPLQDARGPFGKTGEQERLPIQNNGFERGERIASVQDAEPLRFGPAPQRAPASRPPRTH